jgi:hypothetical protein
MFVTDLQQFCNKSITSHGELQEHLSTYLCPAAPAYAGAQGVYLGEDQINIQLPASLRGAGAIGISLVVDGQASNSVEILFSNSGAWGPAFLTQFRGEAGEMPFGAGA